MTDCAGLIYAAHANCGDIVLPRAEPGRIRSLDALRGIAALAVVLFHYTYGFAAVVHDHEPPLAFNAQYGNLGVHLFFIVSGLVILRTLERCTGLLDFTVARFARLYPAYLGASLIAMIVIFGCGYNYRDIGPGDALVSLTMLSSFLKRYPVDASFWTLSYEVIFYGLAGLTYFVFGVRRIELACLVWLAVGVAGLNVVREHYTLAAATEGQWSFLFVLGMMIHLISQRRATLLTWMTVGAAIAMCFYVQPDAPNYLAGWQTALVTISLGLGVWGAVEGKLSFLGIWPLLFLGDISYSLYLVHQTAGLAVLERLERAGVNSWAAIAATLVCAVGTAAVLRRQVELPGQRFIKRFAGVRLGIREHAIPPSTVRGYRRRAREA